MEEIQNEMQFLDSVVDTYVTSESSQDRLIKSLAIKTFKPFIEHQGHALEFGCSDGFMSSLIAPLCRELTIVEGSRGFIEIARKRLPENVRFVHSLFEDFNAGEKYDYIFASYVLEHVVDAVGFLKRARDLLKDGGFLFIVVPNARAFSRQLARQMGILQSLYELTPNDMNHGHRRVYDRTALMRDIEKAGLGRVSEGGLLFKLLADFQMDKLIDDGILGEEQQEGLYKMGLEYPDLAGSLFTVCRK